MVVIHGAMRRWVEILQADNLELFSDCFSFVWTHEMRGEVEYDGLVRSGWLTGEESEEYVPQLWRVESQRQVISVGLWWRVLPPCGLSPFPPHMSPKDTTSRVRVPPPIMTPINVNYFQRHRVTLVVETLLYKCWGTQAFSVYSEQGEDDETI